MTTRMMTMLLVAAAVSLVGARAAADPTDVPGRPAPAPQADPSSAPPPSSFVEAKPRLPEPPRTPKSPAIAGWLSIGTTLGGLGLTAAAVASDGGALSVIGVATVLVGPSLGHIYARNTWNPGLQIRLVGTGVVVIGAVMSAQTRPTDALPAIGAALAGVATIAVGTIYEMATAPRAAERYNRRWARARVVPIAGKGVGMSVVGSF